MSWSEAEERDFAKLMAVGHLQRLPAIRLYRRNGGDLKKALGRITANAGPERVLTPEIENVAPTGVLGGKNGLSGALS